MCKRKCNKHRVIAWATTSVPNWTAFRLVCQDRATTRCISWLLPRRHGLLSPAPQTLPPLSGCFVSMSIFNGLSLFRSSRQYVFRVNSCHGAQTREMRAVNLVHKLKYGLDSRLDLVRTQCRVGCWTLTVRVGVRVAS